MIIHKSYDELISLENIFSCWREFRRGKTKKRDVMEFERNLEDNIFQLHDELKSFKYRHSPYSTFHIYDPKHRIISKALVRDRLVHHVIFNELYRIFDPTFIFHSYSSRLSKGTHLAVKYLAQCLRRVSHNYTRIVYALKCDIKKFFWSVDRQKLVIIIQNKIKDERFLWLINKVVQSFSSVDSISERERVKCLSVSGKGLPIGNVTSQIFANIYLNELDQFVKHRLKTKYYFRYADDFIVVDHDKKLLQDILPRVQEFLQDELLLELHPDKVFIRKFNQGIDFLGYVILPHYLVLRTKTKKRILKKIHLRRHELENDLIGKESFDQSLHSYLGILRHCQGYEVEQKLREIAENSINPLEALEE